MSNAPGQRADEAVAANGESECVQYIFQFDLPPFAKERPRMTVMGRGKRSFVKAYTPERTKEYETRVRALALEQMGVDGVEKIPAHQPIHISCVFCMPRPAARKRDQYHLTTPDLDNMLKAILDGLQGALLEDDKSVVSLSATKRYSGHDGYVGTLLSVTLLPVEEKSNAKPRTKKITDAKIEAAAIEYPVTALPVDKKVQRPRRSASKAVGRAKKARGADGPTGRRNPQTRNAAEINLRSKMFHGNSRR